MQNASKPERHHDLPSTTRDEARLAGALCLIFKLKASEGRMLAQLLTRDYSTKEELIAAASLDETRMIATGTLNAFLSSMRKRLARFGIEISTIPTMGYGLDGAARDKIHELLAEHDRAIRPLARSGASK